MKYNNAEFEIDGKEQGRCQNYNPYQLEMIKQYIWDINEKNDLIQTEDLCCLNTPNKISIHEYLSTISIYLSYIKSIKILKSPTPNIYYIYMQMKNKEYANIFYNTFNYTKINPIEIDYFVFAEVKRITFQEPVLNGIKY